MSPRQLNTQPTIGGAVRESRPNGCTACVRVIDDVGAVQHSCDRKTGAYVRPIDEICQTSAGMPCFAEAINPKVADQQQSMGGRGNKVM